MGGRPFKIYKIRTMHTAAPKYALHPKSSADPRTFRVGRWLRRLSIDELPQLWNVLRGEMGLVGPRPELLEIAEEHGLMDHPRHTIRPGMTGPWQVSKNRPGLVHENVHLDVRYVEHVSLLGDLKIILQTVAVLAHPSGV